MKSVAITCAMDKELTLVRDLALKQADKRIFCRKSGIGKVNAALTADSLIREHRPDIVLSIGCAGTFQPGLKECDAVVAERVAYHDVWCGEGNVPGQVDGFPLFFECEKSLVDAACAALPEAHRGLLISGDQFFISEEEDLRQKGMYPDALAVDMEGAAVAQVCHLHGIPFLAVKIISDTHLDGKQAQHYEGFWQDMAGKSFAAVEKVLEAL
ncbi:MAG: 5'-methylthioadenosine/S-adenosylhomocysteine nucleosidase [Bacteroidales bacterium]|nr:5'-methylthioadenosine/S-adenosylhomocysteine nucleosidase [Candidatus Cryptobacteroides equifaecalis]